MFANLILQAVTITYLRGREHVYERHDNRMFTRRALTSLYASSYIDLSRTL